MFVRTDVVFVSPDRWFAVEMTSNVPFFVGLFLVELDSSQMWKRFESNGKVKSYLHLRYALTYGKYSMRF